MPEAPLNTAIPDAIQLPSDLLGDVAWLGLVGPATNLNLRIAGTPATWMAELAGAPEVVGIQRLITLARTGASFIVRWDEKAWDAVRQSAAIFPLLAIAMLLSKCKHEVLRDDGSVAQVSADESVKALLKYRFARDFFSDREMVVCVDRFGGQLPWDLYSPTDQRLRTREDFETLVVDAITAHVGEGTSRQTIYKNAGALGVVVAELVENTDIHGRLDLQGRTLGDDAFRGVIFKRIKRELPIIRAAKGAQTSHEVECFEVSVFDSGIGYFQSYTRGEKVACADLEYEWKVLHNCLERHYHPELRDHSAGHRAMGLYEVLRAIQSLKGRIEIRTGRLYAYRTFLEGELQAQMKEKQPLAYHAWPVPKLLDLDKKYVARPSEHEPLAGSSVRIIIPLG